MRLSWNEIRARAARFAEENAHRSYEKGETAQFYIEFFEVFGIKRQRVAVFERQVARVGRAKGFIDLFWPCVLLVEQKSAGRDLEAARRQAEDYCLDLTEREHPRYLFVCDFQHFELYDLAEREEWRFPLADLPRYVEAFGFMIGVQKRTFLDQPRANIEASELLGAVHDAMEESGYRAHDLERFLVRLLFCLFADDTGIFEPRGIFESWLTDRTGEDGSDLGSKLMHFFEVLDTDYPDQAKNLDEDLKAFPYINGELFREPLRIPSFDAASRKALLEAAAFSWDAVSPAIFGSLFQSVMDARERRRKGAHYTTEKNILKVIGPLFLDDLRAEFERLNALKRGREGQLEAFRRRLGTPTFLDPACGCGNFLIIAYRELRALELDVLRALFPEGQRELDVGVLSTVDVDQFYGIELEEFPARIAEVAMWMTDHIANNRLSLAFGQIFARIPLRKSPHIRHADALEIDWNDVLPAHQCSYVLGNPPFVGFTFRGLNQQKQMAEVVAMHGVSGNRIDFVTAWFFKAAAYAQGGRTKIAFVATNSIMQGEQVSQIWPTLFGRYRMRISFGHRTFAWGSEARGVAHVHVVIVGLCRADMEPEVKRLFSYHKINGDPVESQHKALSAYLFDATAASNPFLVIERATRPLADVPRLGVGTKPVDGGHYIFDDSQKAAFLLIEPQAEFLMRPFIGGREFLNGISRWLLVPSLTSPHHLRQMPQVMARIAAVRKFRETEAGLLSKSLASEPTKFHVTVIPRSAFLALPEVSSERREYLPVGWLSPPSIPSNKLIVLKDANPSLLGILSSKMHHAWMAHIGGRLKSDFQYSSGLVYNNFPCPALTPANEARIGELANGVLAAREQFPGATLADLYDPDLMPPLLRRAHQTLDRAVDRLYRREPFAGERERVEHLFGLYERMVAPVEAAAKAKPKRARRAPVA